MKAISFLCEDKPIVIVEDEHKQVQLFKDRSKVELFTSYEEALKWAHKEVINARNFRVY